MGLLPLLAVVGCGSDESAGKVAENPDAAPTELTTEQRYAARVAEFVKAFNDYDLEGALSCFAESATLTVNRSVIQGHPAIRGFLAEYGAGGDGALAGATMAREVSYFTGDSLLVLGRIFGTPRDEISGFPASNVDTQIAFGLFLRFDEGDRFASGEGVLNWGGLLPSPI